MAIDKEQVEHVARLARLGLTAAEVQDLTTQLSRILEHVQAMDQLDTSAVEPTFHVLPDLTNVFRPDSVGESLSREKALAGAPDADTGCFRVPKITEGS